MIILVTGSAGFIGSAVCHRLLDEGHRVIGLDKLTYAANPLTQAGLAARDGFVAAVADIVDAGAVNAIFAAHRPDGVLHLAAESHVDRSIDAPGDFIATNVQGTFTLLEAARRHWLSLPAGNPFKFVHVSTDEVYGALGPDGRFSEDSPYAPNSPYAASKASADHLARAWSHTYGLPVVITNCTNNYGPRQFPEKLIPLMILNARAGRPLPVYGDGGQVRDWLFVEDHAEALCTVLMKAAPGSRYMIGGAEERTNLDLVHGLCAALDSMLPLSAFRPHAQLITHVKDRPGHDRRYAADFSRITADLGWRPSRNLDSGLAATVRWYLDNEAWCQACGDGATRRQGTAKA